MPNNKVKSNELRLLERRVLLRKQEALRSALRRPYTASLSIVLFPIAVELLVLRRYGPLHWLYSMVFERYLVASSIEVDRVIATFDQELRDGDFNQQFRLFTQQFDAMLAYVKEQMAKFDLISTMTCETALSTIDSWMADGTMPRAPFEALNKLKMLMCKAINVVVYEGHNRLDLPKEPFSGDRCLDAKLLQLYRYMQSANSIMLEVADATRSYLIENLPQLIALRKIELAVYMANLIAIFVGDYFIIHPLTDRLLLWYYCSDKNYADDSIDVLKEEVSLLTKNNNRNSRIARYISFATLLYAISTLFTSKEISPRLFAFISYLLVIAGRSLATDIHAWYQQRQLTSEIKKRSEILQQRLPWDRPKVQGVSGTSLANSFLVISLPRSFVFGEIGVSKKQTRGAFKYCCKVFKVSIDYINTREVAISTKINIDLYKFIDFFKDYLIRREDLRRLHSQLKALHVWFDSSFEEDEKRLPIIILYADLSTKRAGFLKKIPDVAIKKLSHDVCRVIIRATGLIEKNSFESVCAEMAVLNNAERSSVIPTEESHGIEAKNSTYRKIGTEFSSSAVAKEVKVDSDILEKKVIQWPSAIYDPNDQNCKVKPIDRSSSSVRYFTYFDVDKTQFESSLYSKFENIISEQPRFVPARGAQGIVKVKNPISCHTPTGIPFFADYKAKLEGKYGDVRVYAQREINDEGILLHFCSVDLHAH